MTATPFCSNRRQDMKQVKATGTVCLLGALALAGCATTPTTGPRQNSSVISRPASPTAASTRYVCDGDRSFAVDFNSGGGATLYLTGQALKLKSAPGAKYSDGSMTLWTKGRDEALLLFNGAPFYKNCHRAQ